MYVPIAPLLHFSTGRRLRVLRTGTGRTYAVQDLESGSFENIPILRCVFQDRNQNASAFEVLKDVETRRDEGEYWLTAWQEGQIGE
jgi:hypothetical protein